jgi:diadenosine tetraphosphatase ApaH/serine/threonine PP2A family protein phosphatase
VQVFVVHGGLSTQEGGVSLAQVEELQRYREPESGLMSDLLWSGKQRGPTWQRVQPPF